MTTVEIRTTNTEDPVVVEIIQENVSVVEVAQQGPAGQGVPTGGTTGQVLTKASAAAFDTQWSDPAGGGGATEVFMQPTEPTVATGTVFAWLQTGLGDGTDFTFYVGKGL